MREPPEDLELRREKGSRLRLSYDKIANLRHVFDGETDAFSTESTVFNAAVGHVIDAPGWDIADNHTADIERVPDKLCVVEVSGEDARLQSKGAVVDFGEGITLGDTTTS